MKYRKTEFDLISLKVVFEGPKEVEVWYFIRFGNFLQSCWITFILALYTACWGLYLSTVKSWI